MLKMSLIQYGEPNYFKGRLYYNDEQVSLFFFSSCDLVKDEDGEHLNLFGSDDDTCQVIRLKGIKYGEKEISVINKASKLSPNLKRRK